jgi:succinate-semialdehyde dehydrogenase/glutarate-semialdehyde dehydrogenase
MSEQAELTRPGTRNTIETVNPATGEPGKSYEATSVADAHAAAKAAHDAFLLWRRTDFGERSAVIHKAAAVLRARRDEFARLMTDEMGKTLTDGRAEVEKCASHSDWFADQAQDYLAN